MPVALAMPPQENGASLRWNWSSATVIFAVALLIRLAASMLLYPLQLDPRCEYWGFGWETGRIAHSISVGRGFASPVYGSDEPTAWMAPVYPYLLAGGVSDLWGLQQVVGALNSRAK